MAVAHSSSCMMAVAHSSSLITPRCGTTPLAHTIQSVQPAVLHSPGGWWPKKTGCSAGLTCMHACGCVAGLTCLAWMRSRPATHAYRVTQQHGHGIQDHAAGSHKNGIQDPLAWPLGQGHACRHGAYKCSPEAYAAPDGPTVK